MTVLDGNPSFFKRQYISGKGGFSDASLHVFAGYPFLYLIQHWLQLISFYLYHLESRWRNSQVLVCHGPLLIHLLGVAIAIYFHYGVIRCKHTSESFQRVAGPTHHNEKAFSFLPMERERALFLRPTFTNPKMGLLQVGVRGQFPIHMYVFKCTVYIYCVYIIYCIYRYTLYIDTDIHVHSHLGFFLW